MRALLNGVVGAVLSYVYISYSGVCTGVQFKHTREIDRTVRVGGYSPVVMRNVLSINLSLI